MSEARVSGSFKEALAVQRAGSGQHWRGYSVGAAHIRCLMIVVACET